MATASEAWFKLINPESSWSTVSLEGIEYVDHLKEAIKKKVAPKLDAYSIIDLTIKAKYDDKDPENAVELDPEDDLKKVLERVGRQDSPVVSFAKNIRLFVFLPLVSPAMSSELAKSVHEFDVTIVSPKRTKSFKWTVNIEHATLDDFKDSIRVESKTPALEDDGAVLSILNASGKHTLRNDHDLRQILHRSVSKSSFKFTVVIETPSKAFNEWIFRKVCELYDLSSSLKPDIDVFPAFSCGSADLNSNKATVAVKHLMAELKLRQEVTPLNEAYEATKSIYSYCYLASGVSFYKDNFKLIPEKPVEGHNGYSNYDYAIECRSTERILGVIEVKKEDFMKGFAQACVQLESSLTDRKRKAKEINGGQDVDKVFGIVTDASEWYFMECTLEDEEKPLFKLSKPVLIGYDDEFMEIQVKKVLAHIVWLLDEAQKPIQVEGELRKIKRVRPLVELAEKSGTVDKF
ncbi:hypothetical protein BDZ91DRAFT_719950 [Kalaharituber pfeilii]|nr:hypothetical protein BDZ91DRAFT_719950 [Kalaharituber pfeilii]